MLSELAAELRAARDEHGRDITQLRTDLAGLSTLLGENATLLGQVMPRLRDLEGELGELADRVDTLFIHALAARDDSATDHDDNRDTGADDSGGGGGGGPAAALQDWPSLSAEAAEAEWRALGDWVADVLGPFYELTRAQLPDCWALHRPAMLELVWLHRTYLAAHATDASATAAGEWHTRWRPAALATIAAAIPDTWCRPGEHYVDRYHRTHPDPGPPPAAPVRQVPGQRPGPGNHKIGAGGQITAPRHWGPHFETAREADLGWRRGRDAATGNSPGGG